MESHLDFELIHPFSDGNGRTGRALIVQSCLKYDIPTIIIEKEMRNEYISALNNKDKKELVEIGLRLSNQEKIKMNTIFEFVNDELQKSKDMGYSR